MVESINEPFYLVVQMGHSTDRHEQQQWKNFYYADHQQDIPTIRVRPFQHDTSTLYCIQCHDLQTLKTKLKLKKRLILRAHKSNIMYVYHQKDIHTRAYDYMIRTQAFIEIENTYQTGNFGKARHILNITVDKMKTILKNLYDQQYMTSFQYQQMDIQYVHIRLDYIIFIPNVNDQERVTFEPMMISTLSPLMPICRYLNRLLESIYFNQVAYTTTVYKGADIIQALEIYQQHGYLQPTTLFITLHIEDPYTSVPHEHLVKVIQRFLHDFTDHDHIQGMKMVAIEQLIQCILQHQYVMYNSTIYQQRLGGSTGLYLIDLLMNIYYFYWQQPLLTHNEPYEVFGRCFNDIFFTWNQSEEKLHQILATMKINDSNIHYTMTIQSQHSHYLDAHIHHIHPQDLHTHVYHDWKYEPYILPTLCHTPSLTSSYTFRMALIRAVLCCSQLQDFEDEQQYIESSFIFNQFPLDHIRQYREEFFHLFHVADMMLYPDQATYDELRRHVRRYDQEKCQERMNNLDDAQKQCIRYIYSSLKRRHLIHAKKTNQIDEAAQQQQQQIQGIKTEIIGVPRYPINTR